MTIDIYHARVVDDATHILVVAAALATRSGPRRAELAGVLAQMVVVIAPLLAIHVLVDLALTLAGKRSLADRLARTRVDRR